jgi:hypothetical protein
MTAVGRENSLPRNGEYAAISAKSTTGAGGVDAPAARFVYHSFMVAQM